jgi:hypothetical protein
MNRTIAIEVIAHRKNMMRIVFSSTNLPAFIADLLPSKGEKVQEKDNGYLLYLNSNI